MFLTGKDLTKAIRDVMTGTDVRCAVAYWGDHGFSEIDDSWRIVCDIVGGSTSVKALESLGAPRNDNLRHAENLHSKVYLSDKGVVVGSANASRGGLGLQDRISRLTEAGVFQPANTDIWNQAAQWFEQIFEASEVVREAELDIARTQFTFSAIERLRRPEKQSLLQQIVSNPSYFSERQISFIIARAKGADEEVQQAKKAALANYSEAKTLKRELSDWEGSRQFIGWSSDEMDRLDKNIVEFYFGPRGGGRDVMLHKLAYAFPPTSIGAPSYFCTEECAEGVVFPDGTAEAQFNERMTDLDWKVLRRVAETVMLEAGPDGDTDGGGIWRADEFALKLEAAFKDLGAEVS